MNCHHTGYFGYRSNFLGVVPREEEAQQKQPIIRRVGAVDVVMEGPNADAEIWSTPRYEHLRTYKITHQLIRWPSQRDRLNTKNV